MERETVVAGKALSKDELFQKGQRVFFKGREAKVINVTPVFTIRIEGENEIICGNIAHELSLQGS